MQVATLYEFPVLYTSAAKNVCVVDPLHWSLVSLVVDLQKYNNIYLLLLSSLTSRLTKMKISDQMSCPT